MPVGQRQPFVSNVSEIKQYNNACVMSFSSTAVEINATQQNNVLPTEVMHDMLIDIEDAQAEPEFISSSLQPPIHLMHTASSVDDSSRATPLLQHFQGRRDNNHICRIFQAHMLMRALIITIIHVDTADCRILSAA